MSPKPANTNEISAPDDRQADIESAFRPAKRQCLDGVQDRAGDPTRTLASATLSIPSLVDLDSDDAPLPLPFDLNSDARDYSERHIPVFDSGVSLRPACHGMHGGFKGKSKASDLWDCPPEDQACVFHQGCRLHSHSHHLPDFCSIPEFHPAQAVQPFTRIRTNDPHHDLRRWIFNPNETLEGHGEDRDESTFLDDSRFTAVHMRSAFKLALSEIAYTYQQLECLQEYGERTPYDLPISETLEITLADAELQFHPETGTMKPTDGFEDLGRDELMGAVLLVAREIDFLRNRLGGVANQIVERKMSLARQGSQGEQENLMSAGYVDEEWVREECHSWEKMGDLAKSG